MQAVLAGVVPAVRAGDATDPAQQCRVALPTPVQSLAVILTEIAGAALLALATAGLVDARLSSVRHADPRLARPAQTQPPPSREGCSGSP